MAEAIREGKQVFDFYEQEYARAKLQGRDYTVDQARADWLETQQARKVAQAGNRPATEIPRQIARSGIDVPDGVRTTPAAETGPRRARTAGRIVQGAGLHQQATTGPTKRDGRDSGGGRG